MDLFILIAVLVILAETTFLTIQKHKPAKSNKRKIYVDTSALIDGRILDVARTGFIDGDFIILKDVLLELQLLADGKDMEKRNRARAGLETVSELERVIDVNTEIVEEKLDIKKVDEILLKLAKRDKAAILTVDYTLIKVAEAERIATLNVNDLALAVRNEFIPGEKITLKITEKGSNRGQGVGNLPNGTMVVVDKASSKIGKEVEVELLRLHETSSGKMIFAKLAKNTNK